MGEEGLSEVESLKAQVALFKRQAEEYEAKFKGLPSGLQLSDSPMTDVSGRSMLASKRQPHVRWFEFVW